MAKAMAYTQHSKQSEETSSTTTSCAISPAKLASLRSNYLQQMRDLHSLFEGGAINEKEFLEQKAPKLKALKPL